MLVVGLTGGIAAGKTTASRYLLSLGLPVIDCDKIAHSTSVKGSWGYRRIVAAFGPEILLSNGAINRETLAKVAFADAAARRRLNKATHAPVALELLLQLLVHWLTCKRLVVVDMPLLFETGSYKLTSCNVVVACNPELQLQRVMQRDSSTAEDAQARINAQMPLQHKMQLADVVLLNDGTVADLHQQVERLVESLLQRSRGLKHMLLSPIGAAAGLIGLFLLVKTAQI